jgi:hypothetical protein
VPGKHFSEVVDTKLLPLLVRLIEEDGRKN